MPHIYLTESDIKLGIKQGQVIVTKLSDGSKHSYPFSLIDGISVFGKAQLSTQLIRECLASNVSIGYYSGDGHYFGAINSFSRIDPERQKRQIYLTDNKQFCVEWSRNIIDAKIRNSLTLLTSMSDICVFSDEELSGLRHSLANVKSADSVEIVLGFEGNAAKNYFKCLPKLLRNEDFLFEGRSTRPPKDAFNSMLSYGYSLFYRNIIGAIESRGLHPYFAYMHKTKFGHASLASDLVEEYRAALVDKTVLDFVNSGEIDISDFYKNDEGATYMTKSASRRLTNLFSEIMVNNRKYFLSSGDGRSFGFQAMLDKKLNSVIEAIERKDPSRYKPFIWEENF